MTVGARFPYGSRMHGWGAVRNGRLRRARSGRACSWPRTGRHLTIPSSDAPAPASAGGGGIRHAQRRASAILLAGARRRRTPTTHNRGVQGWEPVRPYGARTRRGCRTNGLNADPGTQRLAPLLRQRGLSLRPDMGPADNSLPDRYSGLGGPLDPRTHTRPNRGNSIRFEADCEQGEGLGTIGFTQPAPHAEEPQP